MMTTDVGTDQVLPAWLRDRGGAAAVRLRAHLEPVVAWAYALIVLQLVVRGFVVTPAFYFQEDFTGLDAARRLGLGSELLLPPEGGQLQPGLHLATWLLSHLVETSFWPAATTILVLQVLASVLLLHLLRVLTAGSALLLVPLATYLFTPLALGWSTWWSAAVPTLVLHSAMLLVLLSVSSPHRARSPRWTAASVLAHAVGLSFSPHAVLLLPATVATHLLVLSADQPWRERFRAITSSWPLWLAHALVLIAYGVAQVATAGTSQGAGSPRSWGDLGTAVFKVLVPGIFGGPWHGTAATDTTYPEVAGFPAVIFVLLLLLVVAASWAAAGQAARDAWLLLAGFVVAEVMLLDGLGLGTDADATDPRVVAAALPMVAIALAAAFTGPGGRATNRTAARLMAAGNRLPVAVRGAALVLVSALVTTAAVGPEVRHEYARNYTLGLVQRLEEDPERSVVRTSAPEQVAAGADVGQVVNAVGRPFRFDRPSTDMHIVDGLGALRPMDLYPGASLVSGPVAGCGWPVRADRVELGAVPDGAGSRRVLRVGYYSADEADLVLTVGSEGQSVRVPAGLGRAFFVVGSGSGSLDASVLGEPTVCVTDWAVGLPWVAGG